MRKPWWRSRRRREQTVSFVLALLATVVFVFPVYWIFSTSFKSPDEIFAYPPAWYPEELRLKNYLVLFEGGDAWAIWNSLVVASTSTAVAMLLGVMAAYSLARFRTGGDLLAVSIISLRMIPPIVIVFPLFLLYVRLALVDTYAGLTIVYVAMNLPYVIWIMRGYVEDIPRELEDSALIDGCSRWGVLSRVVFPMARNGIIATAVFAFIMAANEFVYALVLSRSQVVTFPLQISLYFSEQATYWAKISAMSVLGSLPVFVTVIVLQRYLVRGISMGAVKG